MLERRAEKEGPRRSGRGSAPARAPGAETAGGAGRGGFLVCARCRRVITSTGDRIEIDGLHEHSQVNPHGVVWTFRCYARAPGCAPVGPPSSEFTWFPGHSWQIEHCTGCGWHLGWPFRSADRGFHGLIAGRLVEAAPDDDALS
jgi:hypothetical protein